MSEQIDFKTRWRTVWVLAIIIVATIGWDFYAAFGTPGAGDTVSEVVLGAARKHPVIPLIVGIVLGHLLWPQEVKE